MNLQMVDNPDIRTATFIVDFHKSNVFNNRFVKSFTVSLKTVIQKKKIFNMISTFVKTLSNQFPVFRLFK